MSTKKKKTTKISAAAWRRRLTMVSRRRKPSSCMTAAAAGRAAATAAWGPCPRGARRTCGSPPTTQTLGVGAGTWGAATRTGESPPHTCIRPAIMGRSRAIRSWGGTAARVPGAPADPPTDSIRLLGHMPPSKPGFGANNSSMGGHPHMMGPSRGGGFSRGIPLEVWAPRAGAGGRGIFLDSGGGGPQAPQSGGAHAATRLLPQCSISCFSIRTRRRINIRGCTTMSIQPKFWPNDDQRHKMHSNQVRRFNTVMLLVVNLYSL